MKTETDINEYVKQNETKDKFYVPQLITWIAVASQVVKHKIFYIPFYIAATIVIVVLGLNKPYFIPALKTLIIATTLLIFIMVDSLANGLKNSGNLESYLAILYSTRPVPKFLAKCFGKKQNQ